MRRPYLGRTRFWVAAAWLAVTTAAITAGGDGWTWLLSMQPGPAWVRLATGAGISAIVVTTILIGLTLVLGRFFCAVFCPLGTVQDIVGGLRARGSAHLANRKWLRYAVALIALIFLTGGWAAALRLVEPYSRFAACVAAVKGLVTTAPMTTGALVGGLVPVGLVVLLALWKRRVFCVSLCPVGTVLGLVSRFGLYRVRLSAACTGCGHCARSCPTGCIDCRGRTVDAERCVLCFRCVASCPTGCAEYTRGSAKDVEPVAMDFSRRRFLVTGAVITVGAFGAGVGASRALRGVDLASASRVNPVLPPGALDSGHFNRVCTGCQLCAGHCPNGVIIPSLWGFGPVQLDYTTAGCEYECALCNAVCPTGALRRIDLVDKQWLKIGEAMVDRPRCRVIRDGVPCSLCADACPKGAIMMVAGENGHSIPEVASFHCIGCGACQAACPTRPKAITVSAIEQVPMGF